MSDHDRASQSRIARLCEMAMACLFQGNTLCRHLGRLLSGPAAPQTAELDERVKRDIGIRADAGLGVNDVRAAFYRKLLERGQPLP